MSENLTKLCKKASEIVKSLPKTTRVRVVSHYDADGITSAGIICRTLHRGGYDFHCSLMRNPFTKGLEHVKTEDNELIIFTDMGSGQIDFIENMGCKSIIIDHHQSIKGKTNDDILQINANLCGINGNYEACGASLSYCFAKAFNLKNEDLVSLAIAGATGDKQYIGGFRGYNKTVLDEGLQNGFFEKHVGLKLSGNIFDAFFYSVDPYYSDISGNEKGITDLLEKISIDSDVDFKKISSEKKKKINSYLIFKLLKKGCEKNILDTVIRDRYCSNMLFNCEVEGFADLLDACGKGGNRGVGLSMCLGDEKAFEKARSLEKEYKRDILDELLRLENEGFEEKKSFRYFYSKDSSLGGVIGGIATNFMLDRKKPLISIVRNDDEIHVSCRGNQYLVSLGLDLGSAMKQASARLGGNGGGHAIASGATIDIEKENDFLEIVDNIISKQLGV